MRISILALLVLGILLGGCSSGSKSDPAMEPAALEAFAREVFRTLVQRDAEGFVRLCMQPDDLDRDGKPLMHPTERHQHGMSWKEWRVESFRRFLRRIDEAGGPATLEWIRFGGGMGRMPAESGFIGNMYVVVSIGGQGQAIEIGCTQVTQDARRVITDSVALGLQSMSYYEEMARQWL